MNLKQITPEEAIEVIKQGKINDLWWKLDTNTVVNNRGYQAPRADELHKKTWFIEERKHDSPRIN